jgi:hypothetical protein
MADQSPDQHPTIRQFRSKLDKSSATIAERNQLVKFRNGPKCDPALHPVIDALLKEFDDKAEAMKAKQVAEHQRVHAATSSSSTTPSKGVNGTALSPVVFGDAFHNPYTFLAFGTAPKRRTPTLQTADEVEKDRFTGLLRLRVRTLSPLLTCEPGPERSGPHRVLSIGNDVIVPASGVRGALRTLLTVVTGGTLGYVDPTLWLTQGRDLPLGPRGKNGRPTTPERVFLARVVEPGSPTRPGVVEVGDLGDPLVKAEDLARSLRNLDERRPKQGKQRGVVEAKGEIYRLSGRPIKSQGKREGRFVPSGRRLTLPPERWSEYEGRHAHAEFPELRAGDLVWLEPISPSLAQINRAEDVASIQWARWGRKGKALVETLRQHHKAVVPDAMRSDGLVDEVTDLFGQVPLRDADSMVPAFASRVRPENLVFRNAAATAVTRDVQLAPLLQPHPGCLGFYRDNGDLDEISMHDPLRGYKVYRNTRERGATAPWHYATQPVFGEDGTAKPPDPKLSRCVDLLDEGCEGELTLSLRSLSRREIALLLAACSVDWRLGGGKPLGLGHCRVTHVELVDEAGASLSIWDPAGSASHDPLDRASPAPIPEDRASEITDLADRLFAYQATQRPVVKLRYPRAVERTHASATGKLSRGGNVWFKRHASPRKSDDDAVRGMQVFRAGGALASRLGKGQVSAQALPPFNPKQPFDDLLFGYDSIATKPQAHGLDHETFEPFEPGKHRRGDERSSGNQSASAETRRLDREGRSET